MEIHLNDYFPFHIPGSKVKNIIFGLSNKLLWS